MFKMKLLAGVAAVALSGAASAAISQSSTGNTELTFNAFVNGVGYTFDLPDAGFFGFGTNVRMNSLIGNTYQTPSNVAAGIAQLAATELPLVVALQAGDKIFDSALTGFDSFVAAAGTAAFQWNVWSSEVSGTRRIIQTVAATPTEKLDTSSINSATSAFSTFVVNNNQGGTHSQSSSVDASLTDGYRITTDQDPELARTFGLAPRLSGSYASFGNFGDELTMYAVRGNGSGDNTGFGGFAQLVGADSLPVSARVYIGDAGEYRLQIAVVPEPETYAMLLAGLGLIGFAARRRRA